MLITVPKKVSFKDQVNIVSKNFFSYPKLKLNSLIILARKIEKGQ